MGTMPEQTNNDDFFIGVLGLKDGKWTPQRKFKDDMFGSALMFAEELDKAPDFDAVKVLKIPNSGKGEQKEMWVSPRLKARMEAEASKKVRAGVQKTKDNLRAERMASVKPK